MSSTFSTPYPGHRPHRQSGDDPCLHSWQRVHYLVTLTASPWWGSATNVGAVAPPGASQRRLSTLQPKGSARHGVRPCAHHNSHSSKYIYDPSFQWPSWPKRRASFEPGYVTPNLEIPGLYWTAFKYARMSSIFEDLTPLLVTHVK